MSSLSKGSKGILVNPLRILIHGCEGVGKTSFAASAPDPAFICAESGADAFDVFRFDPPKKFAEVLGCVQDLTTDDHSYKTLVIDSLDWLEPIIWDHVIATDPPSRTGHKARSIEEAAGGWQKGFDIALVHWKALCAALESLQIKRRMHVVMTAHSEIKKFSNPEGDNYDRYQIRLHPKAAGIMTQWVSAVLFASFQEVAIRDGSKVIGAGSGARILRTERRAAFDAKNRYGLPLQMPLTGAWDEIVKCVQTPGGDLPEVLAQIREVAVLLGLESVVEKEVEKARGDTRRIKMVLDRLRAKALEKSES